MQSLPKEKAPAAEKPVDKKETTPVDRKLGDKKEDSLSSRLANFLPAPVETILDAGMKEPELARTLLITVSRQLFVALVSAIALGLLIIFLVQYVWTESSATFPIVMLCGMVGGFVGIQRRLKDLTMLDLTLLADSRIYLLLAPSVGGVLALVLYILFLSGLLQGDLFPKFLPDPIIDPKTGLAVVPMPNSTTGPQTGPEPLRGFLTIFNQHAAAGFAGYAKLMFWCFLAGFSERFVTDVIGKFEGNAVKTIK